MGSIRSKLALSMLIGIAVSVVLAVAVLGTMKQLFDEQQRIYEHPYAVGQALRDIRADIAITEAELAALANAPSKLRLRRFLRRTEELDTRIRSGLALIEDRFLGDPSLAAAASTAFANWVPVRAQIISFVEAGDTVQAYTFAKTDGARQLGFLNAHLDTLLADATQRASEFRQENRTHWHNAVVIQGAVFLLAFAAMAVAFRFVYRGVIRPTEEISGAIREVAAGELAAPLPHVDRPDEIGDIARSAKIFLETSIAIRDSQFDVLTGLPQRAQLSSHMEALRTDLNLRDRPASLIHLDIDRFSELNDSLGRSFGDQLLSDFARRLRDRMRVGEFVAREGGDSFIVLTLGCEDEGSLYRLALALRDELALAADRIILKEDMQNVTCTIGSVLCDPDTPVEDLLANAEMALTEARKSGIGAIATYTDEMGARLRHRREVVQGLKFAVSHDEIVPFFQPQIDAITGQVRGFEALVRWNHPEQGVLSPWQFVDIARASGLLDAITDLMIAKGLDQLVEWHAMGLDVPRLSLNFGASDLRKPDFVDRLHLQVEAAGLEPGHVCVELLESAMIEEVDDPVTQALDRLSKLGFPIELDDFGTGHAAISTLHLVKLSGVKIDRRFITSMHEHPDQQHLTRGILRLSRALNITTIAEGVECEAEREILVGLGCDVIQGFLVAQPMSGHDATHWLRTYRPEVFATEVREPA